MDLTRLEDFARDMRSVPLCQKDRFLPGHRWHYDPMLPEFTVCAECFTCTVWPEREGSRLAKRINDTARSIENEPAGGNSCQMWSPRMIRVFREAARSNNSEYLVDEAQRRARFEHTIKMRWDTLATKNKKLGERQKRYGFDQRIEDDIKSNTNEMYDLAKTWKQHE